MLERLTDAWQWRTLGERCPGALPLGEFLCVARHAAAALAGWHGTHLAHGCVNSLTLQLADPDWQVRLAPPGKPALPYLAPEQTARMQRRVDPRSDCYALGVVFYHLLTGVLPFKADDPLEWLHAHVARIPVPPHRLHPEVPLVLSEIVMKMLAKPPDQRYQRIAALQADLEACHAQWQAGARIARFPIGAADLGARLQRPQRLVGRAEEMALLQSCYARAATGGPALILITGAAGVGKSALIAELEKTVLGSAGIFLAGKFDGVRRHVPYATLGDALRQLLHTLAAGDQAARLSWRAQINSALGEHAALLFPLVPALRELLDAPPSPADPAEPPQLPERTAQHSLFSALRALLCVLAQAADALVLFLDDLQWADPASLAFLDYLLVEEAAPGVLVVGAYRDGEVRASHPLTAFLTRLERSGLARRDLYLAPLSAEHVTELLADMLRTRADSLAELGVLVHRKTGGNALFVVQFMRRLEQQELIGFDTPTSRWRWNLDAIRRQGYTDNVVELMVENFKRTLSSRTLGLLLHAACLGQRGAVTLLAAVEQLAPESPEFRAALEDAVDAGILDLADEGAFRFVHDRFQQALYSMLTPTAREAVHVRVARLLVQAIQYQDGQPERDGEQVFEIADHYNLGGVHVRAADERRQAIDINLRAGLRAKAAGAYASAVHYLASATRILGNEPFTSDYRSAFTLYLEGAACEFLNANGGRAEHLIAQLLLHTGDRPDRLDDRVRVLTLHIAVLAAAGRYRAAVDALCECAGLLGETIDADPDPQQLQEELDALWRQLEARTVDALAAQARMRDTRMECLLDALATALPAAFVLGQPVLCALTLRMVSITLRHGTGAASAMGYINFAWVGCLLQGRPADAARFEELALLLAERQGDCAQRAAVHFVAGQFVSPGTRALRDGLPHLLQAFDEARSSGNLSFASFCCYAIVARRHSQGDALPALQAEIEARLDFVQRTAMLDMRLNLQIWRRFVTTLVTPRSPGQDAPLSDPALAAELLAQPGNPALFVFHSLGMQAHYLLGDHEAALAGADAAHAIAHTASPFELADLHLFHGLALGAAARAHPRDQPGADRARVAQALASIEASISGCADNFRPHRQLLEAELARLDGDLEGAANAYGCAIESAHRQQRTHLCAIGWELAAGCHRERGWPRFADSCMASALDEYAGWGALAKLAQLRASTAPADSEAGRRAHGSGDALWQAALLPQQLDLLAVAKAAQRISGEVNSGRLHENLLRIVLEHAGAQTAQLLLMQGGQLRIEAIAEFQPDGFHARSLRSLPLEAGALPQSVIHYVLRTRAPLVLGDACTDERFVQDGYLRTHMHCAVLCVPIERGHTLAGILYAENRHLPEAFANVNLEVLELLVSQAAISLENTSLVEHLQESQQLLSAVVDNVPACVYVKDLDGRYLYINHETEKNLGSDLAQVLGKTDAELFPDDAEVTDALREADRSVMREGRSMTFEETMRLPNGQLHTFLSVKAPLYREQTVQGLCGISSDVSEQRRARERIEYLARYDALTGLPNRSLLIDRLGVAIVGARRRESRVALLFLDLDRFKTINDTLGHWAGDLLLKEVAQRLRGAVREVDTVARLAGDEFIVLLTEVGMPEHARQSAEKLIDAVCAPFQVSGHQVSVGASIGISLFPDDGADSELLLKHADMAMYHAKQAGRAKCQFFDPAMNLRAQERLTLENQLRGALANEELFLVYQPQLDLVDRRIGGAEALLRWRHPGQGLIPPTKFIPIAEECGLIAEITRWVIEQVCRQMRCWRDSGVHLRSLAVNISALSLAQDGLCEDVAAALARHRLSGDCLELEMTEGILMRDVEASIGKLRDLKSLGVGVAIDDFGTGYSSLSYLKQLPVDKLKIDQSFVRDIAHDPNDSAITSTIIAMARHLNLKVIAEGVEDAAAERFLYEQQCDQMQGYLVSRPLAPAALAAMIMS